MRIFGIHMDKTTYGDFFDRVTLHDSRYKIYTPNPEILLTAWEKEEFSNILKKGDVIIPDGIGIFVGYQIFDNKMGAFMNKLLLPWYGFSILFRKKWLHSRYGEKICGSDVTEALIEYAAKNDIIVYIVDPIVDEIITKKDAAKVLQQQQTKQILEKKYPGLEVRMVITPSNKCIKEDLLSVIDETKKGYLFCTFGAVKQERYIENIFNDVPSIKLAVGCGGSIDFLTGFYERSPEMWRKFGLEWLWRLSQNPKRQAKKIKRATLDFLKAVYIEKAKNPTV